MATNSVDRRLVSPNQRPRLGAPRLAQAFEKEVFALEHAHDRPPQGALQGRGQADEERGGDHREIEGCLPFEVAHELADLLGLEPVLALKGRDGQLAQVLRIDRDSAARRRLDDRGNVPEEVEDVGRPAQEGHVLLEVDADARR